jgi:hypothetical protein
MIQTLQSEIVVVGGGVGGVCAALASARQGADTLLLERAEQLGGTGVHSPVGLVCQFFDRSGRAVNTGIHRELFPDAYAWNGRFDDQDPVPVYDERDLAERYRRLCAAEPRLRVLTRAEVAAARRDGARIDHLVLTDGRKIVGQHYLDATADGNLSVIAGAEFQKGRPGDGAMMTATLTFRLNGIRRDLLRRPDILTWGGIRSLRAELDPFYKEIKAKGQTTNLRAGVLCFPCPGGDGLLFNSTAVAGVDPTLPGSVETGRQVAEIQALDLIAAVRRHPALAASELAFLSPWLGIRESRRVMGDHLLTEEEIMAEARFDDMVAACAYGIDIHDPLGGKARLVEIPGTGYYHIPWRCLLAKGLDNLALGSRCISGDTSAHSSYRVMSGVSAIGQAAGTGAALAARGGRRSLREVPAAEIRGALRAAGQFVEP